MGPSKPPAECEYLNTSCAPSYILADRFSCDMFLLAKLGVDFLIDDRLPKDIKAALKALPSGSSAYQVAHEDAMKRVEHQGPKSTKFAKTIISWMVCAKRQLTLPELRHALAFEVGDLRLGLENLPLLQDIVLVCAGLVTIDPGSGIISLVHYTTQEYFERTVVSHGR
ncbi:hypothetical protein F5144DRAFT_553430 [Chaetomium tenue]|uniref:Uncharacterized protein n=1 Tax=Chaetomium tenue TaxID=1854479 RepID=A0ACB7PL90_9PEZI|nr:hypothetical protein F5144DRAFT_553430 [Chaetomium globosum]